MVYSPDCSGSLVQQKVSFCWWSVATLEATTTPYKNHLLQASYNEKLDKAPKQNTY